MEVIILKIIAFIVILLMGGIFAMIPFFMVKFLIKNERESNRVLALGNALAGGIFLGGGFIHLLPEAASQFIETGIDFRVPMAELLSVTGFLSVFFLEKVIFLKSNHHHSHPSKPANVAIESEDAMVNVELDQIDTISSSSELVEDSEDPRIMKRSLNEGHGGHSHDHGQLEMIMDPNSHSALPYLLLVILSVHSVIAGFAMGVQKDAAELYAIFFAILSHKWVEAFALGVNLLKNSVEKKTLFKCVILYSTMVPIGLVVGSILSLVVTGTAALVFEAVITAIASGTFIYVALVDVLLDEFRDGFDKFPKFFLAVFGFGVITASVLLFDED